MHQLASLRVRPDSESGLLLGWNTRPTAKTAIGFGARAQPEPPASPSLLCDDTESHVLVIAPTGAGKGRNFIIPNLLSTVSPCIVLDIKGEAARVTARYRRSIGHEVVILDPFHIATDSPASLNPLDLFAGTFDTVADDAFMLASLLSEGSRGTKDPFWDDLAENLLAGIIAHIATAKDLPSRALGDLCKLIGADDVVFSLAVLMDNMKDMHPFAHQQIAAFLGHEGEKVRTSVLSVAQQHTRIFTSPAVQQAVSTTSFDLGKVTSGAPLTIYIVIPPAKLLSHGALIRMWLSTLLGVVSQRTAAPELPTVFMVDELAQLGGLRAFKEAVTLLRGYGLRCCLFLQSHAQLKSLYPRDHESITENCGAIVTFGHTKMPMSRQMADLMGDISADALFAMTREQVAVQTAGNLSTIARRVDYLTDSLFAGRADINPRHHRANSSER
jgi:type IV secretion system protein VirD4